ncbi:tRNA (N6-threonylcarbamoyladenosine(37)-N6)-methyltransferase TrmO [Microbispora sp. CA-102843]|uniref:tRNA (N6-threonylcarbamoyladenosine(37)-N6)-methyltransferase TrmO n=1 Tax=Microbispora sp. CA-102843 TaxID=3239952 RepID=UPI003D8EACFB
MSEQATFTVRPVGVVRSILTDRTEAPRQGREGAPDAWLEIETAVAEALDGMTAGDEVLVLTWFHEADRETLRVHPRGEMSNPLTGVFATRSPDRPNPIGLHRVTVLEADPVRGLRVHPIEAIDGTPVLDIKPVLDAVER